MGRLGEFFDQIRRFLAGLPPGRRTTFVLAVAAVLAGTVGLVLWVSATPYSPLLSRLSPTDGGAVVEFLKAEKIPFRVTDSGGTIEVESGRVDELRLALAGKGLPLGGGVGFELFDKQAIGRTDFVQRLDYQRALQGELARTISGLAAVESARVHLALPQKSLFLQTEQKPSASVVLKLKPGRGLDKEQVRGIVNLVSASVEGLPADGVTVVDSSGQILSRENMGESGERPGERLLLLQRELERGYTERIESLLTRVVGEGRAIARVTVQLDPGQQERTEEAVDPDRTAVKSDRRVQEKSRNVTSGGAPGVSGTLTNDPATNLPPEAQKSEKEERSLAYEVTKVTSRRVEGAGAVQRVSVAVVVDGTWQGEGANRTFVPRPPEELDRLREVIKRTVGFDDKRGDGIELTSAPLQEAATASTPEPTLAERLAPWASILSPVGGVLLALIILFGVIRPMLLAMVRGAGPRPMTTVEELPRIALPGPPPEAEVFLEGIRGRPQQTARVIQQWLATPDA